MKFKHSLFTRRRFLNGLLAGWGAALSASFLSPLFKFAFPPYQEPEEVILAKSQFGDLAVNEARVFPWGAKPGILKKNDDGTHTAFVAVCTHLDCNVIYKPEQRKFFCACHDGWYDEKGINIAGPPPSPLRTLIVTFDEENIIIKRTDV